MRRRITTVGILTASMLLTVAFIMLLSLLQPHTIGAQSPKSAIPRTETEETAQFTIDPIRQGRFISAGMNTTFQIPIFNSGPEPTDIYDLDVSSTWPVNLFNPGGIVPLTDTNGNGQIDTGFVNQGQTFNVVLSTTIPITAVVGDQNNINIDVKSWRNPSFTQTTYIQVAIPAPFVQAFRDHADGAMSMLFTEPNVNWLVKQTPNRYDGTGAAIAETPEGYIYAWSKSRFINGDWNTEIEFMMTDKFGNATSSVKKLTDHSNSPLPIHDIKPVVEVSSQGVIGLAWHRQIFNDVDVVNHNIFLALIDQSANVFYGPANITKNDGWVTPGSLGIPTFDSPRIASTKDDRFFLAWHSFFSESDGDVRDIYYTVRDTSGGVIVDITNFTNDLPDDIGYSSPTVAAVNLNHVVLAWIRRENEDDDVFYTVLDTDGNTIKNVRNLSINEHEIDWLTLDAVELAEEKILVAWKAWGCSEHEFAGRIKYAIIDSRAQYNRTGQPVCLGDPGIAAVGDWGVSVTADSAGNAIITWTDEDQLERHHFYYALVDGKLNIITQPMIYHRTEIPPFSTSYEGNAIASRLFVDGSIAFSSNDYRSPSSELARITVNYNNLGTLPASGVVITATIDPNINYNSDSAPVSPTLVGNDVVWILPDMEPGNNQQFDIFLAESKSSDIGIPYPITVTLEVTESDILLDNNQDHSQVTFLDTFIYLPIIMDSNK